MLEAHDHEPDPRLVDLEVDLARCGISRHCHWTARRKADLLRIMRQQPWAIALLRERYCLTEEELDSWTNAVEKLGHKGLQQDRVAQRRLAA